MFEKAFLRLFLKTELYKHRGHSANFNNPIQKNPLVLIDNLNTAQPRKLVHTK